MGRGEQQVVVGGVDFLSMRMFNDSPEVRMFWEQEENILGSRGQSLSRSFRPYATSVACIIDSFDWSDDLEIIAIKVGDIFAIVFTTHHPDLWLSMGIGARSAFDSISE